MPLKPKPLPAANELRQLFRYDPESGAIYPRVARTNRRLGVRCDNVGPAGYRVIWIKPLRYYAHRIAWAIFYGYDPPEFLDHRNGDRTDNRLANLRSASHSQNLHNMPVFSSNTSGCKGVYRRPNNKWGASITVNRKKTFLGVFDTVSEARTVVRVARRKLHGEFARDS